ncbi:hypothetical protein ABFS83_05G027300 [Erythranthe nasuta]
MDQIAILMPEKLDDAQNRGGLRNILSLSLTKIRQIGQMFKKKTPGGGPPPLPSKPHSDEVRLRPIPPPLFDQAPESPAGAPVIAGGASSSSSTSSGVKAVRTKSFHMIIVTIRDQELGKALLSIVAGAIVILIMNHETLVKMINGLDFVLMGFLMAFTFILVGTVIRKCTPKAGDVIEQLGIVVMLISFNGLVASVLPVDFSWVVVFFASLCVSPFIIAIFFRAPPSEDNESSIANQSV